MDNLLFVGKVLHEFEQLASTNSFAQKILSKSNPPEGTVISTYNQYQGRGQIGSSWESAPGRNISLSVIFYPHFLKPNQQFLFNQAMSLAVRSCIANEIKSLVRVKWPNDLLINQKKMGGILIQNNITAQNIQSSILGIGLNINQKNFNQAPNPISLSMTANKFFDLDAIRLKLFQSLERYYLKLKALDFNNIEQEYLNHLYKYEEEALYQNLSGDQFLGVITGITSVGKLKVRVGNQEKSFGIKEIQLVN